MPPCDRWSAPIGTMGPIVTLDRLILVASTYFRGWAVNLVDMPDGENVIAQFYQDVRASLGMGTGFFIQMKGSIQHLPLNAAGEPQQRGDTTLTIRMDKKSAVRLAAEIVALAKKMNWPLPAEDEPRSD